MSIYTIISPAKRLGSLARTKHMPATTTRPEFESTARELALILSRRSTSSLMDLMKISRELAELNRQRYQTFPADFAGPELEPSILQFQGEVFQSLQIPEYGSKEHKYLKNYLGILSGMYGLLRPYDAMHPYRLEMGTRISVQNARNLYQFWGKRITDAINRNMSENRCKSLLSLASDEYAKCVDFSLIQGNIATAEFKEYRAGQWKVVSRNSKRARGTMLNWIIWNRPAGISALKKFNAGYEFAEEVADANGIHRLVFHKTES
ncbi:MAG: YaaA family protein [Leptospiraceae bacterium]|nr:YaaA family protein [Leptospiraceae bacterium]